MSMLFALRDEILRTLRERERRTLAAPMSFCVTGHPDEFQRLFWEAERDFTNIVTGTGSARVKTGAIVGHVCGMPMVAIDALPRAAFYIVVDGFTHAVVLTEWPEWLNEVVG